MKVPLHGYRAYIYQWETEIDALLFLKHKFGEYKILEGSPGQY